MDPIEVRQVPNSPIPTGLSSQTNDWTLRTPFPATTMARPPRAPRASATNTPKRCNDGHATGDDDDDDDDDGDGDGDDDDDDDGDDDYYCCC